MQVYKLTNGSPVDDLKPNSCSYNGTTLHCIYYQMTDMEIDNTTEVEVEKKSWYAAMREKHSQEMAALQAKLDEQIAGRAADKKFYFEDTMKRMGYEWDFGAFADKYSSLDINDMVSLYAGQNWKPVTHTEAAQPTQQVEQTVWAKSVIAWANPTTEMGGKKLGEMNTEELLNYAKTQTWYHN